MATSGPSSFLLAPLDNGITRIYVPKLLFFPEPVDSDVFAVIDLLRQGLSRTLEAMPLLSGTLQVVDHKGALCVTAPWATVDEIFKVNDLRDEGGPGYQSLRDKRFPLKDLDASLLPLASMTKSEKTVMLVQMNIIKGGFIMTLCLHHSFTDGNGTSAIAKVWAAFCGGEDGSRLLTKEVLDRERLMHGWENAKLADVPEYGILSDVSRYAISPTRSSAPHIDDAIIFFPKSKLVELKTMASASKHEDRNGWISTNDVLCALLSCCLASATYAETRADRSWVLNMVVGGRRLLDPPLPEDYIGNVLSFIRLSTPSHTIDSSLAEVAEVAHLIREKVKERDERYFRKLIAALSSVEDLTKLRVAPPSPSEDGLKITSWANQDFYNLSWGDAIGSGVERVRPYFPGATGFCVILPELKAPAFAGDDCGLEVALYGVERHHMERLKQDGFFMRFAQWRCN